MIFKLTASAIKDNGRSFILQRKIATCFAVGDTLKGWLSDYRERERANELRKRLGVYGMIMMHTYVFEHGAWEIVSVQNDI